MCTYYSCIGIMSTTICILFLNCCKKHNKYFLLYFLCFCAILAIEARFCRPKREVSHLSPTFSCLTLLTFGEICVRVMNNWADNPIYLKKRRSWCKNQYSIFLMAEVSIIRLPFHGYYFLAYHQTATERVLYALL